MYEGITKAIQPRGLSPEQEAENYETFRRLMESGVYLPDLVRRAEAPGTPAELFPVMEQAVADDPDVVSARGRMDGERSRILEELCARDEGYRRASEDYRGAVTRAYIRHRDVQKPAED